MLSQSTRLWAPVLGAFLVSGALAAVQQASDPAANGPVVSLFLVLNDRKGKPAPTAQLAKEDLLIEVDGKPVEVVEVRRTEQMPVRFVLLLDMSKSSDAKIHVDLAATTAEILEANLRKGLDSAFVVAFRDQASEAVPLRAGELADQLRKATFRGGTAFYDALLRAADDLAKSSSPSTRRIVLVLSDGGDNASTHSLARTRELMLHTGTTVYSVNTGVRAGTPWSHSVRALQELARSTGGRYFEPYEIEDLRRSLDELFTDLKSTYWVVCRSPVIAIPSRKPQRLKIKLAKDSKLSIQVPDAYYVQPN